MIILSRHFDLTILWDFNVFVQLKINVREHRRGNQNGQSRETGNTGHTRRRKTKLKHKTICVGHHYSQTNTNNVNKTCALLQKINSCAKSAWYTRRQHSYNICKDFLSHNSWMKNLNFTKKYADCKTINSNNCAKFEVNWPRGSQLTARHTKHRLQFDE